MLNRIMLAAIKLNPNDGSTMTCTDSSGKPVQVNDPGAGLPIFGGLLNSFGNWVSGTQCVQDGPYRIQGLIKSSADSIAGQTPPTITGAGDQPVGATQFMQAHTAWFVFVLFVAAICIAAARISLHQRAKPVEDFGGMLVGMVVILGCGAGAVQAILLTGQAYAPWILDLAGNGDYATNMTNLLADIPDPSIGDLVGGLMVGVAWFAAGLQWLMFHIVGALLPLAVGLWPLFASIEAVSSGKPWRTPVTKYILAMATYQFFVASFYAVSFAEIGDTTAGGQAGEGVLLLVMAALMLPMLVKVFAPFGSPPATGVSAGGVVAGGVIASTMVVR